MEYERLTGEIISAAIQVHRSLGPGFLESIYENALKIELKKKKKEIISQKEIAILYENQEVGKHRIDLLVDDIILVELKALKNIEKIHFSIVRSYLRALNKKHGLILNFGKEILDVRRVISLL